MLKNKHKGKKRRKLINEFKKVRRIAKNNLPKGQTYKINSVSDLKKAKLKIKLKLREKQTDDEILKPESGHIIQLENGSQCEILEKNNELYINVDETSLSEQDKINLNNLSIKYNK